MNKGKRWLILFFTIVFVGILGFMAANYIIDPTGYFAVEKGDENIDANGYTRAAKSKYIKKYADEYDAVILGGSKSGVLSTELLSDYTGLSYYNFYIAYGCFEDFLTYANYLIEEIGIREITLHLSSIEVQYYSRAEVNDLYKVPAVVNGNAADLILENLNYLCRNITSTLEYAAEGNSQKERGMDSLANGERNYSYAYSLREEDADAYLEDYVNPRLENTLKKQFTKKDPSIPAVEQNIEAMKELKQLCDDNDVNLNVIIGPVYIVERAKFECDAYYDYLRELVKIVDIWDFSDYNDINMNPYNFINEGHYDNAVADLMLKTIYGEESREGFGTLLTEDNIEEYLEKRSADREALREEYLETGSVTLGTMEDESYMG